LADRPTTFSHTRYLAAKKTVDDRALNRRLWERLRLELSAQRGALRVLELGAGIGTMIERLVEWGMFAPADPGAGSMPTGARTREVYLTLVDSDTACIAEARRRLVAWAGAAGWAVADDDGRLRLELPGLALMIEAVAADALAFVAAPECRGAWDLLIANAFLDLIDVRQGLPRLLAALRPGGLFYFTINFDAGLILEPTIDRALDDRIAALTYAAMDGGRPTGGECVNSRIGRQLFHEVRRVGGTVLDVGSCDWVVFPTPDGYPADEAYFLHHILHFIAAGLADSPALDAGVFAAWLEQRRQQIDAAELVYVAHQLDLLGRVPVAPAPGSTDG
jgi:SAM-dependent methyltransferase